MQKLTTQFQFLILLIIFSSPLFASQDPIVTRQIEGNFHEVSGNVRMAIIGKGINIAHVLPASQMLHRTGSDFGYKSAVYGEAETYEFCSARISHKLSRIHPDNIVLCPFTISVYTLKDEPGMVRLSYRIPTGRPGTEEVIKEVVTLIESIIEEASW
jgi:uncharacterized protein (DUF302 family)